MTALIDADSLLYKVAFAVEATTVWNENEYECGIDEEKEVTYDSDFPMMCSHIDGLIENILVATDCDDYELHLTSNSNFRDSNPLGYKDNRKELRKPMYFKELKEYLINEHKATLNEGIEADDMVVYLKTKYYDKYILCAIDKDVLYQTEGTHYNYNTDEIITVNYIDTIKFKYFQCLAGDPSDGYKGCKNIGKVKAKAIVDSIDVRSKDFEYELYNLVLETFIKQGHDEEYLLNTLRLADMHQFDGEKVVEICKPTSTINTGL